MPKRDSVSMDAELTTCRRNLSARTIISAAAIAMLFCAVARADGPWEKYHVTYGAELRAALLGTIGILTINTGADRHGTQLQTYIARQALKKERGPVPADYQRAGRFEPYMKLSVLAATTPVSNFSYHPPMSFEEVGNFRYPVVERCSSYLQIVYDPIENWRTWVNLRDIEQDLVTDVVMLDSLAAAEPGHYFLEVFRFTPDRKCRLYKAPSLDSGFTVISEQDTPGYLLSALEVRKGFVRVANYMTDPDNWLEAPKLVPLGWVRIWDDDGVLLIWVKYEDLC